MVIVLVLAALILAVALVAMLILVRVGMSRERQRWLTNQPPTRTASGARTISGLYVRMPGRNTHADDGTARLSIPYDRPSPPRNHRRNCPLSLASLVRIARLSQGLPPSLACTAGSVDQ